MRSRIASTTDTRMRLRGAAALAVAVAGLVAPAALADTKQECSDAYYRTQVLRDAGKLQEGIAEAQICAREACPKFIRDDCAKWKADLDGRIASIVVEAVDAAGKPVTDAVVSLDGAVWLDRLGGDAQVVSPGPHNLEITIDGAPPQKKSIVVREGEKNRKITFSLGSAPEPRWEGHTYGPWIVGGIGVAVLVAGAITGGFVLDAYSVTQEQCDDRTRTCTPDGDQAQDRGRLLGPVTTTLLVAGGALVTGGIIWLIVAPTEAEPTTTSFFVAPAVSTQEVGIVLGGPW